MLEVSGLNKFIQDYDSLKGRVAIAKLLQDPEAIELSQQVDKLWNDHPEFHQAYLQYIAETTPLIHQIQNKD